MPRINISEAETVQALRLFEQFEQPFKPLSTKGYQRLKEQLKEHGQQKPVVLWANVLVDGYHRFRALKELDIKTVDIERIQFKTASEALKWKQDLHKNRI